MATVMAPSPANLFRTDTDAMNTIPDPRAPSPAVPLSRKTSGDSTHHPDLSSEVATLSTKLINAINHQTVLDDSLQATRHELDSARRQVAQLEIENKKHKEFVAAGILIKREDYFKMQMNLRDELTEERKQRTFFEREKKRIEAELENLTSALFEEANAMVAEARKDKEAADRRSEQLKSQIHDTEELVASQQEQLQDLKAVVERMSSEKDENESNAHASTAPSTPALSPSDKMHRMMESTLTSNSEELSPEQPLRFSHLISPVLRSDLNAYKEFQELLKLNKSSAPPSRVSSGNYSGLGLSLSSLQGNNNQSSNGQQQQTGALASISAAVSNAGHSSHPNSPREPTNSNLPPLKDNKFYKRALSEDIEPTLRLDIAPGLSWLARRTVVNSMTVGSLVVEPQPAGKKFYGPVFSCSLCGENRTGDFYSRKYRFRTSEADDAQRYPLCDYCLARVRATCDYVGFLRLIRDGHWRADTEDETKSAWEESVRLRERMFWTRIGGGVIPAFVPIRDSPTSASHSSRHVVAGAQKGRGSFESDRSDDPFRSRSDHKGTLMNKNEAPLPPIPQASNVVPPKRNISTPEQTPSISVESYTEHYNAHSPSEDAMPGAFE